MTLTNATNASGGPPEDLDAERGRSDLPEEVIDELRLLDTVMAQLRRIKQGPKQADHDAQLTELRDALEGEKLTEDIASVVEQMERMAALKAQQERTKVTRVPLENPYFGHMVLDDDYGKRSVLIGKETFLSDRVRIVDWRNAPISRIFYQYAEGDEYEVPIAGRQIAGEVLTRRSVTIHDGVLERVATDESTWAREEVAEGDIRWIDLSDRQARLSGGAGIAVRPESFGTGRASKRRDKHLPEITSLLDPRQFELITSKDAGLVVIQGAAGSGKTTVALHRIAYIAFQDQRFRPQRALIVVFSKGLANYIAQVLPALGVEGVPVVEFDKWASAQRQNTYKRRFPNRYADDTPALVTRFKTHTAVLKMLEELREGPRREGDPAWLFEELFTDRSWIADGLKRFAPDEFSDAQIDQIHRWCSKQHFQRDDKDENSTLDREDDAILLRMWQVLRGPLRHNKKQRLLYHHIMIDEAQDLSPLEHAVIIECAGPRQSVTLAGDVAQKIDENRDFTNWTDVLEALHLSHIDVSPLQVSYRSTRQIMQLAQHVLGPLAPPGELTHTREGAPCAHLSFDGMGPAVTWLAPVLTDLAAREPTANVALLTQNLTEAVEWYQALERAEVPHITLVDDQDFSFRPGIEVTDIRSSKGLEFDYVIVLGVNQDTFPPRPHARHLLHVGITRAAHQLWLVSTDRPSPLIPDGLPGLS